MDIASICLIEFEADGVNARINLLICVLHGQVLTIGHKSFVEELISYLVLLLFFYRTIIFVGMQILSVLLLGFFFMCNLC